MVHDTIPSAPALPILKAPARPDHEEARAFGEAFEPARPRGAFTMVESIAPAIPTELRVIVEDFKNLRGRLVLAIIPGPGPEDPPYWRDSVDGGDRSDPFVGLEVRKANRLLAEGRTVDEVAGRLAFGLLARQFGLERARTALRSSLR